MIKDHFNIYYANEKFYNKRYVLYVFFYCSHFSRYMREFPVHLAFHADSLYYEFDPKSQRRTIRRRNAENSRSGLSSQRLVSSRRYLSPERTARRGTRTLHHLPMISFSRFSSLHRASSSILTSLSRYKRRGNEEEGRITNCENQEIASSAASQRQAWPMLKKLLSASSLIRFRGRLYPED